jgi:hypothetical protein
MLALAPVNSSVSRLFEGNLIRKGYYSIDCFNQRAYVACALSSHYRYLDHSLVAHLNRPTQ